MNGSRCYFPGFIDNVSSFAEILSLRAKETPNRLLFTYLGDGENESARMTYSQVDQKARGIASELLAVCRPGDRALLLYLPDLDYIAGFMGCLYAGVIAVPAYPPDPSRLAQTLPKLKAIADDAGAKIALSTRFILSFSKELFAAEPELKKIQWLATDDLPPVSAKDRPLANLTRDNLAFLQYTSGSTGMPKGVMVSHGNLIENAKLIKAAFEDSSESFGVSWLPPYHDMGLIGGILQPIYLGVATALMSPLMFLQKPYRWLAAVSRYRGTTSGGPNFAYDLCARKISAEEKKGLDLSCWRVAFNGAEPVREETLNMFANAFAECGFRKEAFYPCYGMAETTLFVSGGQKTALPKILHIDGNAIGFHKAIKNTESNIARKTLIGCGQAKAGEKIAIADPSTLLPCPDGHVGEIWVAGPNVTRGYWNRPSETAQTFQAYLSDTKEGPFLRTGDLGFIENGELYVTGRIKDMIIIRGRNFYPQDIEATAEKSHSALRPGCGAAFSVEVDGKERLVVAYEVKSVDISPEDTDHIIHAIRRAIQDSESLNIHAILLLKLKSIPKTSSGKLRRHACREGFLTDTLETVAKWCETDTRRFAAASTEVHETLTAESILPAPKYSSDLIEKWLMDHLANTLRIHLSDLDPQTPFSRYGLDSAEAVGLAGDLEKWLEKRLPPTIVYDYPTIEALSKHLADISDPDTARSNRPVSPEPESHSIAIVGMGCRFPGADTPDDFWQMIIDQVNAVSEVPEDRWNKDDFYAEKRGTPGKMNTKWGGFLKNVDQFDPNFFGISPREATHMDPQQRLLLEVTWEALENAGIPQEKIDNSLTGVFIGISGSDYSRMHFNTSAATDAYAGPGNALCIAANRISYWLNLHGPSWSVDTACSSSLVAIHQACRSLRSGECNAAIAGGANMILIPQITISFSQAGMMAADGKCKSFDAGADGYVRGEGCGVVILKRLPDALADGNEILAVIRGTAVNQDGRSNSLTAPNGPAQQKVLRSALADAGVDATQISYVEAHGTGTAIGDPIELGSLKGVLAAGRSFDNPCWIGTVKTNIGHLEAASGIAGLIKVIMSLRSELIAPNLHYNSPTPHVSLENTLLSVATQQIPWPEGKRRLAGISGFGFGGTNAHIIVEEAPVRPFSKPSGLRPYHLLTLSAKTDAALRDLAGRYLSLVSQNPTLSMPDLCFSANTGRSRFAHRLCVTASSTEDLKEKLAAYTGNEATSGASSVVSGKSGDLPLAFLFTGQGSQYAGMAKSLFDTQPVFRSTMNECDALLMPYLQKSLLDVVFNTSDLSDDIHQTAYTQPALFAVEYSLAKLWQSWGIEPATVMGHSVGEYVAACIVGVFSLEDGLRLIAARGRLMQELPAGGAMAAVLGKKELTEQVLAKYADEVCIAAYNGPESLVISGKQSLVEQALIELSTAGIRSKRLAVSHAFHSPLMADMLDEFSEIAKNVAYHPPRIPLISNVTGIAADADIAAPEYWCQHILSPVQFSLSMASLYQSGVKTYLECGPDPVLLGMGRRCIDEKDCVWLPSLRHGKPDWQQILSSLGELYVRGAKIFWDQVDREYARNRTPLPNYPFQKKRYWVEATETVPSAMYAVSKDQTGDIHPLLGRPVSSALLKNGERLFESVIRCDSPSYLKDHRIFDQVIFPAAGYLEMALAAGSQALQTDVLCMENVSFHRAIIFEENKPKKFQLMLSPSGEGYEFKIFSNKNNNGHAPSVHEEDWALHASGEIFGRPNGSHSNDKENVSSSHYFQDGFTQEIPVDQFYSKLRRQGLDYGLKFRGIEKLWRKNGNALGKIRLLSKQTPSNQYVFPPSLLDACFQSLAGVMNGKTKDTFLPVGIDRMEVRRINNANLWCRTGKMIDSDSDKLVKADLDIMDDNGNSAATVQGLRLQKVRPEMFISAKPRQEINRLYELAWEEQAVVEKESLFDASPGTWILFSDSGEVGQQVTARLKDKGASCISVFAGNAFERCTDKDHYNICSQSSGDFKKIIQLVAGQHSPIQGIIYSWPLDVSIDPATALEKSSILECDSLLFLVQALASAKMPGMPRLWIATRNAQHVFGAEERLDAAQSPVWGLGRVIALEYPSMQCTRIDLDASETDEAAKNLFESVWHPDKEDQIAYRDNRRYAARLIKYNENPGEKIGALKMPESPAFRLATSGYGILENLYLAPEERISPRPDEVEIKVCASGLNFRDVLNALGMLKDVTRQLGIESAEALPFGGECTGVVASVGKRVTRFKPGDEVIASFAVGSLAKFVRVHQSYVVLKPENLNFNQASTLPITFLTAYYGLIHLAELKPGEKVLIHAAAGGVGQAAVQLAQMTGAQIYATASPGKWDFLKSIGIKYVMNSRTLDFADEILKQTEGKGVDVVFNSLNGDFIEKSLSVMSKNGRFVEIGKIGIWDAEKMKGVRPDVSYFPFDLIEVSGRSPELMTHMLSDVMAKAAQNKYKPLPFTAFPIADAVSAFRFMAQAKHIGKVVISFTGPEEKDATTQKEVVHDAASYMITGGYGALGLAVAQWLAEKGARHLILVGRRGASDAAKKVISDLTGSGINVFEAAADVSNITEMSKIMDAIKQKLPPIKGIIHAAGILADAMLTNQSADSFKKVMAPKVAGAWNLHALSQDMNLDFFVLFSSAAALIGSPGQGNYAAANAFMDGLAHFRRQQGFPTLSINWGPWAGSGMAADKAGQTASDESFTGMEMIDPEKGLETLDALLFRKAAQVGVMPINWPVFLKRFAGNAIPPVFMHFLSEKSSGHTETPPVLSGLSNTPPTQRMGKLANHLKARVAHILGLTSADMLNCEQPLKELGLDSLMAVELNNMIQNDLVVSLTAEHFMENPTIMQLSTSLLKILTSEGLLKSENTDADQDGPPPKSIVLKQKTNGWIAYRKAKPDATVNLFCFHHLGGAASLFRTWGEELPESIDVCPVQLPGREARRQDEPMTRFNELIDTLSDALTPYLDRPFAFFGHSMGTWIAYELAHILKQKHGKSPEHLFAAAMPPPSMNETLFNGASMDESWLSYMEIPDALKKDDGFMNEWMNLFKTDSKLFHSYAYSEKPVLDCPITALGGAQDTLVRKSELMQWQQHTADRFNIELLTGGHMFPVGNRVKILEIIRTNLILSGRK